MHTRQTLWPAVTIALGLILPLAAPAQEADPNASEVLAAARNALGGEQKLRSVKSLSIRGSYRRQLPVPGGSGVGRQVIMIGPGGPGETQMSGHIEIDLVLPDKFIKVDTTTGITAITRTEGFDGDRPLTSVHSSSPNIRIREEGAPGDPARAKSAVDRARAELARLLLGMFATTQPGWAVTYSYVGQAESPDGKAHVIDVKGPDGFEARLFIDTGTRLPLMLTYMAPEVRMVTRTMSREGGPPAGGPAHGGARRVPFEASAEERERLEEERRALEAAPPKMIEYRLFFSDYREVDGVSLPHRIVRGTGSTTTEEWEIKSYKVNPSIKADRFAVS